MNEDTQTGLTMLLFALILLLEIALVCATIEIATGAYTPPLSFYLNLIAGSFLFVIAFFIVR